MGSVVADVREKLKRLAVPRGFTVAFAVVYSAFERHLSGTSEGVARVQPQ